MPLIICPECNSTISEFATVCVYCGFPIEKCLSEDLHVKHILHTPVAFKIPERTMRLMNTYNRIVPATNFVSRNHQILPIQARLNSTEQAERGQSSRDISLHGDNTTEDTRIINETEPKYNESKPYETKHNKIEIGNIIHFGRYTINKQNNVEDIEWRVLDKSETKALILCTKAIDTIEYSRNQNGSNWKDSSVRDWLNHDFFNAAFSEDEKRQILDTKLSSWEDVLNGLQIKEKIFLLSPSEVRKYLPSKEERKCEATDFAISKGSIVMRQGAMNNTCKWWLRNSFLSTTTTNPSLVSHDGMIVEKGPSCFSSGCGVRPALWMEIFT